MPPCLSENGKKLPFGFGICVSRDCFSANHLKWTIRCGATSNRTEWMEVSLWISTMYVLSFLLQLTWMVSDHVTRYLFIPKAFEFLIRTFMKQLDSMIKILSSWSSQAWSDRWSFYGASLSELAVALRNYEHLAALMWVSERVRKYVVHSPPVPPGMACHVLQWPKFTTRLAGYVASRILWREKISSWSQDTSRTWYRLLSKLIRYCVSIIHYNSKFF